MFELSQEIWNSSSAARKQSRHTKKVAVVASTSRREGCASALMSSARQRGQRVHAVDPTVHSAARQFVRQGPHILTTGLAPPSPSHGKRTMGRCAGGQGLGEGTHRRDGSTHRAGGGGPSGQGLHATDAAGTVQVAVRGTDDPSARL